MKPVTAIVEVYKGRRSDWHWRKRDFKNGLKIGASTQGYENRHAAVTNLKRVTGIVYVPRIPYGAKSVRWLVVRHPDGGIISILDTATVK